MKSKGSILVVDDEKSVLLLLRQALHSVGYEVAEATNYDEALEAMERASFDVAMIDKNLPGKSGLELLREVRVRDPQMECMIITGYSSLESAIEAMKLGAFDYITKPFDHIGQVLTKVSQAVERRRLGGEPPEEEAKTGGGA